MHGHLLLEGHVVRRAWVPMGVRTCTCFADSSIVWVVSYYDLHANVLLCTASFVLQAPVAVRGRSLEDILNEWNSELAKQAAAFVKHAGGFLHVSYRRGSVYIGRLHAHTHAILHASFLHRMHPSCTACRGAVGLGRLCAGRAAGPAGC